jgi:hypothetical protein
MDALDTDHTGVNTLVKHSPHGGKFYDNRHLGSKRFYFQAVLAARSLFTRGCSGFQSGMSGTFYVALMRRPANVHSKMTSVELKKLISESDGIPFCLELPSTSAPKRRPRAIDDGIDGEAGEPAPKRRALQDTDIDGERDDVAVSKESATDEASSSSDSSSDTIDGESDSSKSGDPKIAECIEGQRTRIECHGGNRGLRVTCNHHGSGCRKFRSLSKGIEQFGPKACSYFLGAWLQQGAHLPKSMHSRKSCKPTVAQIKAYIQQL